MTSIGSGNDVLSDMKIQSDGKMVVAGSATNGSNLDTMLDKSGNPDPIRPHSNSSPRRRVDGRPI